MTSQTRYGSRGGKPIRKDRLLIAVLVLVAAIVVPLLLRSGCTQREEKPVTVKSGDQTVGTTATSTSTSTPAATSSTPAATTATDVDSVVKAITSGSSTSPTTAASTTPAPAATASSTPKPSTPSTAASPPATTSSTANANLQTHVVKQGETLQSIAAAMNVSVRDLRASNLIVGMDAPSAGRTVYAAKSGLVHTIKLGQTLSDIATTYGVAADTIARANGITVSSTIFAGARLVIPGASSAYWDTVTSLSKGKSSTFIWPLLGEVVSSFAWRTHPVLGHRHHHDGIDIDVQEGTAVYAAAGGEIYFNGEQPGYGNVVILQHEGGYYTLYGHLKSAPVKKGQYVEKGQKIAVSGNSGISSGPHLHFELRNGEFPIDPMGFLP